MGGEERGVEGAWNHADRHGIHGARIDVLDVVNRDVDKIVEQNRKKHGRGFYGRVVGDETITHATHKETDKHKA